jgi:murein DD-endopeptidase MepM/ murein hydrolase activator NlpD
MPTAADYRRLTQQIAAEEWPDDPAMQSLFERQMAQESINFDPNVVEGRRASPAGAQGVAQFMPATARGLGINPLDPVQALHGGARYLKQQIQYFGGDVAKGLAAYNAGAGTIQQAVRAGGTAWQRHIPEETQAYLRIVQPGAAAPASPAVRQPTQPVALAAPAAPATNLPRDAQRGWTLPTVGTITSDFGNPFSLDGAHTYQGQRYQHFNTGIDIGAQAGAPVQALTAGTVVKAGDDGAGWGPRVVVQDADGYQHSYGHLSGAALPAVGATVAAGQQIGAVSGGQAGVSTGPHLSYDVFDPKTGEPVDPTPWLGQGSAQAASARNPALANVGPDPRRPRTGTGGGGTMTSPAATRATDPTFQAVLKGAQDDLEAARQELAAVQQQVAAAGDDPIAQAGFSERLKNAHAVYQDALANVTKLTIAMNPAKALTPEQVAQIAAQTGLTLAQTQSALAGIQNAQTGTALDIAKEGRAQQETGFNEALALQKAKLDSDQFQYDVTQGAFKDQVDLANALAGITKTNNDAWASYVKQQLDLGNVKLDAAVALTTVRSNQQAHEIAAAAQELSRADFISKQEAWNATHLFHAGQGYQPGFGPNDPLNVALGRAGLGQDVITAAPVDPETFNPEKMLARARGTMPANTYPSDAWLGIPGVQAQIAGLNAIQPHAPEMLTPQGIGLPGVGQIPSYADLLANAQTAPTSPFVAPALPDPATYAPQQPGAPAPPDTRDPSFFGQMGTGVQQAAGNLAGAIGGAGLPNQGTLASVVPPRIRHGDTGAFDVATGASPQAAPPQVSIVPPTQQTPVLPTQPPTTQPYIPYVPRVGVTQARVLPWRRGPDGRLIFLGDEEAA